jgi:hypothetical protein
MTESAKRKATRAEPGTTPGEPAGAGATGMWRIEFKGQRSRDAMLKKIAATLGFPAHFGGNLDALYDSLTDLPLESSADCEITLADLPRTPAGDGIYAAFADAAELWRERGVAMRILRE